MMDWLYIAILSAWVLVDAVLTIALFQKVLRRWGWPWSASSTNSRRRSDWALVYSYALLLIVIAARIVSIRDGDYSMNAFLVCLVAMKVAAEIWLLAALQQEYWR